MTLTLSVSGSAGGTISASGTGLSVDNNNTASVTVRGTLANLNAARTAGTLTYTAATGGMADLTINLNDNGNTGGAPEFDQETASITVTTLQATNDTMTVTTGTTGTIPASALLANDTGSSLTLQSVNDTGLAGTLATSGTPITSLDYTAPGTATSTSFGYTIQDGASSTDTATVNISVVASDGTDNTITGGAGPDILDGKGGADTINAGDGDDLIRGDSLGTSGVGSIDVLTGGNGRDTFIYSNILSSDPTFDADASSEIDTAIVANGYDRITDFNPAQDTIRLENYNNVANDTNILTTGILNSSTTFSSNVLSGTNVFAYTDGTDLFLLRDSNGNNTAGGNTRIITKLELGGASVPTSISATNISANVVEITFA